MSDFRQRGARAVVLALTLLGTLISTEAAEDAGVANVVRKTPGAEFADTLRSGGTGPEMIVVPAGRYLMGCPQSCTTQWNPVDKTFSEHISQPAHYVTITRPFAMSKYEITVADYRRFAASSGAGVEPTPQNERHPAANISWDDANAYATWLSSETSAEYRLPSEAEWEYGARGGKTTRYYFEDEPVHFCRYANHLDNSVLEKGLPDSSLRFPSRNVHCSDGSGNSTTDVGRYEPNPFGLYDMLGNVAEWTTDCWNAGYGGAPSDGSAWESGNCSFRVTRGGSWITPLFDVHLRVASRRSAKTANGIRVVRVLSDSTYTGSTISP